jgi:hypothetical protein
MPIPWVPIAVTAVGMLQKYFGDKEAQRRASEAQDRYWAQVSVAKRDLDAWYNEMLISPYGARSNIDRLLGWNKYSGKGSFYGQVSNLIEAAKASEATRRQRAVASATPGMSAFVGGVAASGVSGPSASIIAKMQQRNVARQIGASAAEAADLGKYDLMKLQGLEAQERLVQGYSGIDTDLGRSYAATRAGLISGGAANALQAAMSWNTRQYDSSQSFVNQMLTLGGGMISQYFGNENSNISGELERNPNLQGGTALFGPIPSSWNYNIPSYNYYWGKK